MMKKVLFLLVISLLNLAACAVGNSQDIRFEQKDVENFSEIMDFIGQDRDLPMPDLVIKVAKHLIGTPYVAGTLEAEPEMLTINTRQTDCILFVETCVALALTAKDAEPSFATFSDRLRSLRYRDGVVDGYASRLHYTSEWALQGAKNGIFREVTAEIGGVSLNQKFNFMSTHPDSYAQLKDNQEQQERIREAEKNLETQTYTYIPKAELPKHVSDIKDGDIICFTSATPGLDIVHVAFAYRNDGQLTFIHASTAEKKVIINPKPLIEYTNGIKGQNGLRVIRLN